MNTRILFPRRVACVVLSGGIASVAMAQAPVARNDAYVIAMNSNITLNALNNDFDPDPGDTLRITGITQPQNGKVALRATDSGITFVPDQNFTGRVTFTYTLVDVPVQDVASSETIGTITIDVVAIAGRGNGPGEQSVSQALDKVCSAQADSGVGSNRDTAGATLNLGQESLRNRCAGLLELRASNPAAFDAAINQITPEETIALMRAADTGAQGQSNMVTSHLTNQSKGGTSFSVNGATWQSPIGGSAGDDVKTSPWSLFASVQLENADKKKTLLENGFKSNANAIVAGVDYSINSAWVAGAAGGFTKSDLTYANGDGSMSSNISSLIIYGLYSFNSFSWDAQIGTSRSSYDIHRQIHYAETGNSPVVFAAQGQTNGQQNFVSSQIQYSFNYKALSLYPSVKISYASSSIDAYGESNAGGFDVNLGARNNTRADVIAGLSAQYALNFNWCALVPNANLNIINEVSSSHDPVSGDFAYAPTNTSSFTLQSEDNDASYYQGALGASVVLPRGIGAFFNYQNTFGYENYTAHAVEAGVRMEF